MNELNGCYTDKEHEEILKRAAAYDRACEEEQKRREEAEYKPTDPGKYLDDLYGEFEDINLDYICALNESITISTRILEDHRYSQATKDRARCQINLELLMIENLRKETINDRQTLAEFKRLSG